MIKTTCVFTVALFIFSGCGGSGGNSTVDTNSISVIQAKSTGATVITGLKAGTTVAVAQNNSKVLNTAFAGGDKNLIIPSGTWYTDATVTVFKDTTISFNGKLQQINPTTKYNSYALMNIHEGNVILNNPHLSQGGEKRTTKPGTHAVLTIYGFYNTGNVIVNGGILEGGGSNNFQGGRNDTVFNNTTFRDSREHLVYANGINGNGSKSGRADGLTFNNCIFERPGKGNDEYESNHLQFRNYKNVEINNCVINGVPENRTKQYGILATGVEGLIVNDTSISGYTSGMIYAGYGDEYYTNGVVLNDVTAMPSGKTGTILKTGYKVGLVEFNNLDITGPTILSGDSSQFNNSTFRPTSYALSLQKGHSATFDNCTWDYSNSTYSKAFVNDEGSSVNFTGTQTKIAPEDGHSFYWGPLANEG